MTLRRKLLLTMLIPSLPIILVAVVGVLSLGHLERAAGRILANNYRSIKEARRMESLLLQLDPSLPAASRDPGLAASFERGLAMCEANITEQGETEFLQRIRSRWNLLRTGVEDPGAARALVRSLVEDLEGLMLLNEVAMERSEADARSTGRFTTLAVTAASCLALLGLAAFAAVSADRISRPVKEVAASLHSALGRGDAPAGPPPGTDEIGLLRSESADLLRRLALYEDEQARRVAHLQGRLRIVMERVLEGILILDVDRRILAANRVARAILRVPATGAAVIDDPAVPESVRPVLAALRGPAPAAERDLDEITLVVDDDERIYRPRLMVIPDGAGDVEGFLVLFWDVTDQRRFEEARRRFIAMLSHQLKTPMTSLSMSVNLLREKLSTADDEQRELLTIAAEDCRSLAGLISDLIDASKGIAADLRLDLRPVDLVPLLRTALRPLMPQAEDRGISLEVPDGASHALARVDPIKFPWVVTNIAGNALRYTAAGGRVTVSVETGDGGLVIRVSDTGVGMRPEDVSRIFEPHVSLDDEPGAGTHGLGLTIAKEIVEAHRGTIAADSRPGEGTTFTIRLPA